MANTDITFDEHIQKELLAQARIQASIHNLLGICWKTCVTGSISSGFSRNEQSCLSNCVDRFLDTTLVILKKIEEQRAQGHFEEPS